MRLRTLSLLSACSAAALFALGCGDKVDKPSAKVAPTTAATLPAPLAGEEPAGELTGVAYSSIRFDDASMVDDSGRLHVVVSDLAAGTSPMPLRVERVLQDRPAAPGLCGTQWRLNWEVQLVLAGDMAMIQEPAGDAVFQRGADGGYISPGAGGAGDRLRIEADRAVREKADGTVEAFDGEGRLVERTDRFGNRTVVRYDSRGLLEQIDGPGGAWLRFTTDAAGRVTEVGSSAGATVQYTYGSTPPPESAVQRGLAVNYRYLPGGGLAAIGYPDSNFMQWTYDAKGRVVGRVSARGEEKFEYSGADHGTRHTDTAGLTTLTRWSADRRLREEIDPLGATTRTEFDDLGRAVRVTDPTGAVTSTSYDPMGRIAIIASPAGQSRYEYDGASQRIAAIVDSSGARQSFRYDDHDNLVEGRIGDEVMFQSSWYPNGMLKSLRRLGEPEMSFTYNAAGQLETAGDSAGNVTRYEYDPSGNLVHSISPVGAEWRATYDALGQKLSDTDPTGATTQWRYGPDGRLADLTDAVGRTTRFEYDERGRLLKVIDGEGKTIAHEYDSRGRITRTTLPDGAEETFAYDAAGNVVAAKLRSGAQWSFTYDAVGKLLSEAGPLNHKTSYRYDAAGRLIEIRDALERVTTFVYDASGRLLTARGPAGEKQCKYGPNGRLMSTAEAGTQDIGLQYDALGRVIGMSRPSGQLLNVRYKEGRVTQIDGPAGGSVTYHYDAAGMPTGHRYANGESYQFKSDAIGQIIEGSNALGHTWRMAYSPRGELTSIVAPDESRTRYSFWAQGRLARIVNARAGIRKFQYDSAGRRTVETDPLGRESRLAYGAGGRIAAVTPADGATTKFEYDLLGRIAKITYAKGAPAQFTYDAVGNLIREEQGEYRADFKYDDADRLVEATYQPANKTVRYRYNGAGHRAALEVEGVGSWTYAYDVDDRLAELRDPAGGKTSFVYDDAGRLTAQRLPNGIVVTRAYDGRGRTTRLAAKDATQKVLLDRSYRYDQAGNLVSETRESGEEWSYAYDQQGSLATVRGPGQSVDLGYDEVGNLLPKDRAAQYDAAEQLERFGDETFRYDQAGRMTQREEGGRRVSYEYDGAGRLAAVKRDGTVLAEFGYDVQGRRIWKKSGSTTTWFVHDGPEVLLELDGPGQVARSWTLSPRLDEPIGYSGGNAARYLLADPIGSVVAASDEKGTVTGRWDYQPFGELRHIARETAENAPIGFTGREFDPETGLYYYRARYYDPKLGRFLTPDPVGGELANPATQHPYQYAFNNPLRFRDPLGTFAFSDLASGVTDLAGSVGATTGYAVGYGVGYALTSAGRLQNWVNGNTEANRKIDQRLDTFARGVTGTAMDTVAASATSIVTDRLRFGEAAGDLKGSTSDAGKSATWTQVGLTGITELGRGYSMGQTANALARPAVQAGALRVYREMASYGKSMQRPPTPNELAEFHMDPRFKAFVDPATGQTVLRPGMVPSEAISDLAHEGFHAMTWKMMQAVKEWGPKLTGNIPWLGDKMKNLWNLHGTPLALFWDEMGAYTLDAIYRANRVGTGLTPSSIADILRHIASTYEIGGLRMPAIDLANGLDDLAAAIAKNLDKFKLKQLANAAGNGSELVSLLNGPLGLTKPDEAEVPDILRWHQSAAFAELEKSGFKAPTSAYPGRPADSDKKEIPGTVQSTIPGPGTPWPKGKVVAITVFKESALKKPESTKIPTKDTGNEFTKTKDGDKKPADNTQANNPTNPTDDTKTKALTVPSVEGKLLTEAVGLFGSDYTLSFHADGNVPPGSEDKLIVYHQNPGGGSTQFKTGINPIQVVLSASLDGKDPYTANQGPAPGDPGAPPTAPPTDGDLPVPSAIGLSVTEAFNLISQDFTPDFKSDDNQTLPEENAEDKMRVISQSPGPYELRPKGTKVMMIIRQLDKGVVPDVMGLSKKMAQQRIAGAGLTPKVSYTEGFVEEDDPALESMRVTAQDPGAGLRLEGDGEVSIVLTRPDTSPPGTTTAGTGAGAGGNPDPGDPGIPNGARYALPAGGKMVVLVDWNPTGADTADVTVIMPKFDDPAAAAQYGYDKPFSLKATKSADGKFDIDISSLVTPLLRSPDLILALAYLNPDTRGMIDPDLKRFPSCSATVESANATAPEPDDSIKLDFEIKLTLTIEGQTKSTNFKPTLTGQRQQ